DRVAVVAVVLRGVDPALRGDGVGAPRAVLITERLDVVTHLTERGRRRTTGEPGAHDDHVVLAAVRRGDQLEVALARIPRVFDRTFGDLVVSDVGAHAPTRLRHTHGRPPSMIVHGIARKPRHTATETVMLRRRSICSRLPLPRPNVWKIDHTPWKRCRH